MTTSKEIMKEATAVVGVKAIAFALKMAPSTLYNSMNNEDSPDIAQRFVDLNTLCGNDLLIKWACSELGGTFVPNLQLTESALQREATDVVASALKEFAEIVTVIGEVIADNKITADEPAKVRKEWEDLKSVMEGFVVGLENLVNRDVAVGA